MQLNPHFSSRLLHWQQGQNLTVAATLGQLEPFNLQVDNWVMYTKRTKRFFTAKGITNNAKKVTVLLTVIGGKAYVLLRNLLAPAKPAEKSFNVLVKIMKDHLKPKSLMIAKRFKFHWHNQHERETVTQYLTELRKFSEQCDFKEYLKEALHDRLVCGL